MAERRLQCNNRKSGSTDENLLKKRSRSEGPHGRRKMRNSMHETTKTDQIKPTTNGRHSMYTGHVSDDDDPRVMHSGSESPDSDIDIQKWTKNPLMLRKSRKSDRASKTDKRRSVQNVDKRESVELRGTSSNKQYQTRDVFIHSRKADSSPSGSQKSKFQRMEENRNKRIDIAVTSDEECSPQLRISRLRQRAMMSTNMGNHAASYEGGINIVPMRNDGSVNASQEFINGTDRSRLSQYEENRLSKYDENFNVDHVNGNNHKLLSGKHPRLPNVLPEYLPENRRSVNMNYQTGNHGVNDNVTRQTTNQNIPTQQMVAKCEPEVQTRQRFSQGQGCVKMSSESPKLRNFNEVKASQPTQLKKADQKIELVPRSPNSSSDSLDDLIESNIQYLESEIESGKLKRQSGNFNNYPSENVIQRQVLRQPLRPNTQTTQVNNDFRSKIHDPRTYVSNKLMSTVTNVEPKVVQKTSMFKQPGSSYSNSVGPPKSERRNIPSSGSATYSPYMQRKQYETNLDLSKSDSHLNECDNHFTSSHNAFQSPNSYVPYPVLNKQTGNVIYVQPNMEEQIQLSENGYLPVADSGMFSDVEYNIEVSERIKKWEKKLTPGELEERRKVLNTIKEYESFSDSNSKDTVPDTPVDVRRELWQLVSPTNNSGVGRLSVNLSKSKTSASDSNIQDQSGTSFYEPKVVSSETNLHRVFRVVNEPQTQNRSTVSSERTLYDRPNEKISTSSRRIVSSEPSGHTQSMSNVTLSESEIGANMQQSWPPLVVDSDSGIRKSWRMSRYEDEINELKELVSDNFNDIRKRFDSDMSETDTKRASSPVSKAPPSVQPSTTSGTAKLTLNIQPVTPTIQRSPVTIRRKLSDQTPPVSPVAIVTPKPERKVQVYRNVPVETKSVVAAPPTAPKQVTKSELKPPATSDQKLTPELWSPNMESRQGLVSIERVKARTLQTIPFSEDPVWKDLEGLATFEKSEAVETNKPVNFDEIDELLKLATGGMDNLKSKSSSNFEQEMSRLQSSESFSVPSSQPNNVMSLSYSKSSSQLQPPKEKLRTLSDSSYPPSQGQCQPKSPSKYSFTPPTIQPLKLNSQPKKKSSTSALDEVLEDIRASLQKKPLSPKMMKNFDTSEENSSTNLSLQSPLTKSSKAFVFPREQKTVVKEPVTKKVEPVKSTSATPGYDNAQSSWKPAPTEIPPQAANVPYIDPEFTQYPYIINGNYHLDPNLLTEKLKSTGLANESSDEHGLNQKKAFSEQALNSILSNNMVSQSYETRSRSQSKPNVHELDQSVDDLRSLAQEVEFKLNQIKSRIVSADENRLDSILLALRKFAPITEQTYFNVKFTPNYESEKARKNKLEEAIGELDKMYESLNLDDKSLMDRASRREETIGFETEHERKNSAKSSSTASIQLSSIPSRKQTCAPSDTRILRKSQIDEIERQTQNEFEDITKSFQVLLDEVTKQCRSVARGSSMYSTSDANRNMPSQSGLQFSSQRPPDEIRQEPPRHQLKLESSSQRAVQDSYNTAIKELESVAMGNVSQPEKRAVQSVMYLNLDQSKASNQTKNVTQQSVNLVSPTRNLDIQLQSKTMLDGKKPQTCAPRSASAAPQFVSMATEFNKPLLANSMIRDTSSSDNQDDLHKSSRTLKVELNNAKQPSKSAGRFRKRGNIEHRKSMPAITKTVETQTVETQTDPPPSVSEMKEKFDQFRKASLQDMLSDSSPDLKYDRCFVRKMSSGRLVDASSSEDENKRGSKIRHSLSAPDIMALILDFDRKEKSESKADKMAAKASPKSGIPKSIKQRHEKARFRSLKVETSVKNVDMTTSMTSDDGIETPTSKPPVYPVWKYPGQVESPSAKKSESKKAPFSVDRDFTKTTSDTEQDRLCSHGNISAADKSDSNSVVRRRTRSFGGEAETEERPRSFHELVATFEQDPKRLEKIRLSGLRKCASEDSMFTDLILQKIYHSESDLLSARKMSASSSKLSLEMKIKT
ncbi:hypothetical protein ACF0H5_023737 [Mactra antiquata]